MAFVTPEDGMYISESIRLQPGVYILPNGIHIDADNVTLDAEGVYLIGKRFQGNAIRADGRSNITIKGGHFSHYEYGIRLNNCRDVTITGVTITHTSELEPYRYFLYLWKRVTEAYGGAILLNSVTGGTIANNDLQHQMNGIMLYNCTNLSVARNNTSFNSGWGIYLSSSSDNLIEDNTADFCNRVYRRPDGTERVEADAAGLVMVHGSCRNKVLRNKFRGGGDGIFIVGYEHPGVINGCNDNLVEDNDCSYSPNNAIEATFNSGNIFRRNIASKSNYGFWMGFSWDNVVEDNTITDNFIAGIAIEHGHRVTINKNTIARNHEGIRLWTRGISVLEYWQEHQVSHDFDVTDNTFEDNGIAFNGYTGPEPVQGICYGYRLDGNTFRRNRHAARFYRVKECSVTHNVFENNVESALLLEDQPGVTVGDNTFAHNAADTLSR